MTSPSVTLLHKEAYVTSGGAFAFSLFILFLDRVFPAEGPEEVPGYLISAMCFALAFVFFLMGKRSETIDESGIRVQTIFSAKQYSWGHMKCISILPPCAKSPPMIQIKIEGRFMPLYLDYTKRSLACIRFYYGEPDFDKYKTPPSIT
ncbi:MAG: hypothetical protein J6B95_06450 [Oscillospiraceae bacterium]|nr:hypothetical protein [Oscillospiraceae bacterium]